MGGGWVKRQKTLVALGAYRCVCDVVALAYVLAAFGVASSGGVVCVGCGLQMRRARLAVGWWARLAVGGWCDGVAAVVRELLLAPALRRVWCAGASPVGLIWGYHTTTRHPGRFASLRDGLRPPWTPGARVIGDAPGRPERHPPTTHYSRGSTPEGLSSLRLLLGLCPRPRCSPQGQALPERGPQGRRRSAGLPRPGAGVDSGRALRSPVERGRGRRRRSTHDDDSGRGAGAVGCCSAADPAGRARRALHPPPDPAMHQPAEPGPVPLEVAARAMVCDVDLRWYAA
uniref:Uncharacterized protein n=1 Tax=Nocardia farcinica TaxID=37329 RepID=A0A449G5Q2_NOCFR